MQIRAKCTSWTRQCGSESTALGVSLLLISSLRADRAERARDSFWMFTYCVLYECVLTVLLRNVYCALYNVSRLCVCYEYVLSPLWMCTDCVLYECVRPSLRMCADCILYESVPTVIFIIINVYCVLYECVLFHESVLTGWFRNEYCVLCECLLCSLWVCTVFFMNGYYVLYECALTVFCMNVYWLYSLLTFYCVLYECVPTVF